MTRALDMHVVVLDDEPFMLKLLAHLLRNQGFSHITTCDNGVAALGLLEHAGKVTALILCDLNMPGMDGIEFIRQVRTLPGYKFMPILFLTTESQQAKRVEAKAAGASGWLVKPATAESLLGTIKLVLR